MKLIILLAFCLISFLVKAQQNSLQFFRPNDASGIHQFETSKLDTLPFKGLKLRLGGNFEMEFQFLRNSNTAIPQSHAGFIGNINSVEKLSNGFDHPMANLNLDAQLAEGIRIHIAFYMTSRFHENARLKGGYIQLDKLLFLHSDLVNRIMNRLTLKIGQEDLDYGDQHFRRTDGGNTLFNPFIENYILDASTNEISGEIYYHLPSGLVLMGGISHRDLDPSFIFSSPIDSATGKINRNDPAYHGKIGFDRQIRSDLRLRISGSFYSVHSSHRPSLYGGDPTGSHYFNVMENANIAAGTVLQDENDYNPFSGRVDPGFSEELHTYMGNLFLKYKGLEFFYTVEEAHGREISETRLRKADQWAGDILYRFPEGNENFWIGFRYNTLCTILQGDTHHIRVNREAGSLGWFITRNIMAKAEYVNQTYSGYAPDNILNGGIFKGMVLEASAGF